MNYSSLKALKQRIGPFVYIHNIIYFNLRTIPFFWKPIRAMLMFTYPNNQLPGEVNLDTSDNSSGSE